MIAPIGGSFLESTDVTVSGDFFPGFDGLKGSARCKFGDQVSTPDLLEAKNGKIVCSSPPRPTSNRRSAAGGPGYEEVSFSVALNTVDFVDYAGYFTYYDHQLDTISPQGGQLQGGSAVTIYGKRFLRPLGRRRRDRLRLRRGSSLDRPLPLRRARAGGGAIALEGEPGKPDLRPFKYYGVVQSARPPGTSSCRRCRGSTRAGLLPAVRWPSTARTSRRG